MKKVLLFFFAFSFANVHAQLIVNNTTLTPAQLVQNVLLGAGVTASNITFNGASGNILTPMLGEFDGSATNVGITTGVLMGSGDVQVAVGPNNQGGATLGGNGNSGFDPDLAAIATNAIYDEAILEFDFIPQGDTIRFKYVFASEEYNEYVCSGFNDVFGFFISGPGFAGPYTNGAENIALIPGTNTAVAINTVNLGVSGANGTPTNCAAQDPNWASYNIYYNNNLQQSVQYDGMTVVLTAIAPVQCGETYHIKLAIGDAGDAAFDSGVFLEEGSFSSEGVFEVNVTTINGDTTLVEGCFPAIFSFTRPDDATYMVVYYDISGTAGNGTDYSSIADSIVFPIGVDTVQMIINTIEDDSIAGIEPPESIIITAYAINGCGDTTVTVGEIWIVEPPDIIIDVNDVILTCPQATVNISATASGGIPGYYYSWDVGGTTPTISVPGNTNGTYIITITDTCELSYYSDTVDVILNVPPPPETDIVEDTVFNCAGSGATLTSAVVNGATPYSYAWSTGATTQNLNFTPPAEGYVYLMVTDDCGQISNTDSAFIDFPDPLVLSSEDTAVVCPGDPVLISVEASGGAPAYSYSWTGGGTSDTTTVNPFSTGNYIVVVTDDCGITENDTVTVLVPVYTPVTVTLTGDTLVCIGTPSTIAATANGGASGYSYYWDNNFNGTMDIISNNVISVVPVVPGYFIVTATDQCGNTAMDSLHVNIQACQILIPNVFSPNGDGMNDNFVILGIENFPNTHLTVFNRWGRVVYENENYQNNWNGSDCSDGTYYFIVDPDNEQLGVSHGYVTILREK